MAQEDKIIAEVEGKPIHYSQVIRTIAEMGEQGRNLHTEEGIRQVGDELVHQELLLLDAKKQNLQEDEEYKKALEHMKDELLKQYAMNRLLNEVQPEEEELQAYYESHRDRYVQNKMKASHILVESEEKAREILQEITDGRDFAEAAKEYSTCPSSEAGGSLGEFGPGQMVKEFDEAAQSAPIGVPTGPVNTQFGSHLILVEDRTEHTSTYDEVKDQIRQQYGLLKQQEVYLQKMAELKKQYKVETFA